MALDPFARDILVLGEEDEVSLSEITSLAIRKYAAGQPMEVVREASLAVVETLVESGWVRVGTFGARGRFIDRTDDLPAVVADVRQRYDGSLNGLWRELFWVRNTSAGNSALGDVPDDYNPFDEDRRSGQGM